MTVNRNVLLVVFAAVCEAIAFVISINAVAGNFAAWLSIGLVLFIASFIP